MRVYTVHAPAGFGVDVRTTPDQIVFVRDGFYIWAFLAGLIWLIWHRLWLALLGYVGLTLIVEFLLRMIHATTDTRFIVMGVIALLMGFEAGSLWRWTLSRRKWRQIDIVVANNREDAERRFFDRWKHGTAGRILPPSQSPLLRSPIAEQDAVPFFPMPGAPR